MVVPGGSPRSRISRTSGFTLIELITVMAIIALLAAVLIGTGRRASETGKVARAKAELTALTAALEAYRRLYGDYPRTDDNARLLQSLLGRRGPTNASLTGRSLLDTARFSLAPAGDPLVDASIRLVDPWGQPYVYAYMTPVAGWANSSPVLYSTGADGVGTTALLAGGFPDGTAPGNADTIFANR